jgi:putative ABC transport system permease protein
MPGGPSPAGASFLTLSLIFLRRDWRAGELRLLTAALLVAVAALASVGFFVDRVRGALEGQAAQLLGADLVVAANEAPDEAVLRRAAEAGLRTARTVVFPSMAATDTPGGLPVLVSVKAVDEGYPLRGGLRVDDQEARGLPGAAQVWVDPGVLTALDLRVGDALQLGQSRFRVAGQITLEPDRGNNFVNFAPRVLMRLDELAATGLVQPASRVTWRLLVAGDPAPVKAFEALVRREGGSAQRIETLENGRPELRATLQRAQQFLALVSLLTALVAAIAIALAARRFSDRHLDACAVMRAIGLRHRTLMAALMAQMLWLALAAGLVGSALGWLAHFILIQLAGTSVRLELPAPGLWPAVQAILAGLVLLLGFAALPLARLAGVPPLRVLRRELGGMGASAWMTLGLSMASFAALLFWFAGEPRLATVALVGFALAALLFGGVAWLSLLGLGPLRRLLGTGSAQAALRVALASAMRRRGASVAQLSALSVGLMALLLLTVTQRDLLESWQRASPPDAPNRFLINIQPEQKDLVMARLNEAGLSRIELLPMIRARLVAINDQAVESQRLDNERARRLVEREFNISYMAQIQSHNRLVAGRWLNPDAAEVSVETGLMQTLGLRVGDRLTFDIAGETVALAVVGTRKVAWDSLHVNFFVVASPAALQNRPQTWITAFHLPAQQERLTKALVQEFPNLTVFDMGAIVRQVQGILEQVVRAVQFLFVFTLLAGVVVLHAALSSSQDERRREAALLRALGASRAQLRRAQIFELAVLGGLAGLLAALGSSLIGVVLAEQVFQFDYSIRWGLLPAGTLIGASLAVLAGLPGLRRVTRTPPLQTLRESAW